VEGISNLRNYVEHIEWLDLSYNKIEEIPDDIVQLRHLLILYLHENKINYFFQVRLPIEIGLYYKQRRSYHEALEARACIRAGKVSARGKRLATKILKKIINTFLK